MQTSAHAEDPGGCPQETRGPWGASEQQLGRDVNWGKDDEEQDEPANPRDCARCQRRLPVSVRG